MRFAGLRQLAEHVIFFQNDILTLPVQFRSGLRVLGAERFDVALMLAGEMFALFLMSLRQCFDLSAMIARDHFELLLM